MARKISENYLNKCLIIWDKCLNKWDKTKMSNAKNQLILHLAKSPFARLHIRGMERSLGIPVQTISRTVEQLAKEGILTTEKIGKSIIPRLNYTEKATTTAKIAMIEEAEKADPYIKRWITELQKIENADIIILFGSIITKKKEAKDIDVMLIAEKEKIKKLSKEINELNKINIKPIHPVYQTKEDLKDNLEKKDPVILNALKGITLRGHEKIMQIVHEAIK